MKSLAFLTAVLALGLTLVTGDAEAARRLGGGGSTGMQRQAIAPQKSTAPTPAPSQAAAPATAGQPAAAAPQVQPKRSWMGPLAGIAAGLGLAALASHFGFGQELANMMMFGLLAMVVMAVIGFFLRRKTTAQQPALAGAGGMQYTGTDPGRDRAPEFTALAPAAASSAPAASAVGTTGPTGHIPADFDVDGFVRNAKVNFLRLQAANDAGNLDDIREFTTPEMFAEIKMNFSERGTASQTTDVVSVDAQVLDVTEEASRYVVSVHFTGQIREDRNAAEPFDEIWHLTKPRDGSRGWALAGIQQVQ